MEFRTAFDEVSTILTKLDALSTLRDILQVASQAETAVKDAQTQLLALQEQVHAAEADLTRTNTEIEVARANFNEQCALRIVEATAGIEKARADAEKATSEAQVAKENIEEQLAQLELALKKARTNTDTALADLRTEIADATAARDAIKAQLAGMEAAISAMARGQAPAAPKE